MAKKKIEEVKEAKIDFSDKKISDIYEAQVVLAMKLDTLIGIMDKVLDYTERKEKGELG